MEAAQLLLQLISTLIQGAILFMLYKLVFPVKEKGVQKNVKKPKIELLKPLTRKEIDKQKEKELQKIIEKQRGKVV